MIKKSKNCSKKFKLNPITPTIAWSSYKLFNTVKGTAATVSSAKKAINLPRHKYRNSPWILRRYSKYSKKRKNPEPEYILEYLENNSSDFEFINGGEHGRVYKFTSNKPLILRHGKIELKPGTYAIKLLTNDLTVHQIDYLQILSKYGLIPKIYIITKLYIIMKFIDGYTLEEIETEAIKQGKLGNHKLVDIFKNLYDINYFELRQVWEKLKISHADLSNWKNILVSKDFKHMYFIDPNLNGIDEKFMQRFRKRFATNEFNI